MRVKKVKEETKQLVKKWKEQGFSIGFVPTMGALHSGHIELIKKSRLSNDKTICSIFVNPLQFNRKEDLDNYPNTIETDLNMLEKEGCDLVFMPDATAFYDGVQALTFDFGILGETMEACQRPGHFEGVAAVIDEFFRVLMPTRAYFGEKDFQQLAVIKWLVKNQNFSVEVVGCETVRAESGLALSSRNLRLSDEGRAVGTKIYEALNYCRTYKNAKSSQQMIERAMSILKEEFEVEYFEIVDEKTFQRVDNLDNCASPRAFVAAHLEGIRLIDNLSLNP